MPMHRGETFAILLYHVTAPQRDLATYLHQHSCNCMSRIYNHNNDMQVLHDCVHGRDMHICIYICLLFSPCVAANQFAFGNASIIDYLCVHICTQMNVGFPKYYFAASGGYISTLGYFKLGFFRQC